MPPFRPFLLLAGLLLGWTFVGVGDLPQAAGQQVRFPQSSLVPTANPWNPPLNLTTPGIPPGNPSAPWPTTSPTASSMSPATVTPVGPPYGTTPSPYGATPSYNPAVSSGAVVRPNSSPLLPPTTTTYPPAANSWGLGNLFGNPSLFAPPPTASPVATYSGIPNTYPSSVYPSAAPPTLFPNSFGSSPAPYGAPSSYGAVYPTVPGPGSAYPTNTLDPNSWWLGNGWYNGNMNGPLMTSGLPAPSRFLVSPRFRHSYIAGDDEPGGIDENAVGINDSDVSLIFQVPRFFGGTQPLYIVPSFSIHLWDGPSHPMADLPPSAYSAFLDFGWETDPLRTFGAELGTRVGVFTDFDTFNSESLRILGKALGRIRLTPTATARIGAYWIDRNRIKLLPAAGILWVPNADTRFDLFFPEPKLSHYLATFGNTDMWWYATGYYGGGAWTIERADGSSDDIDINDMRIVLGLEWGRNEMLRQGHRVAFFEGGYCFNRELIYRVSPLDNIDIEDSFILRAGFVY